MIRRTVLALVVVPLLAHADAGPPPPPKVALVEFASPESMDRLARSKHKVDFFHLANHFEGQMNRAFCGPTTAVAHQSGSFQSETQRIVRYRSRVSQ